MTTALVAFVLAFAMGACVTAFMPRVAVRFGAVDHPDGYRKIHGTATPRLGGIGVFAGFLTPVAVLLTGFHHNLVVRPILDGLGPFIAILAGALLVLAMGAWDDIEPVRARFKLLFQALAAGIAMAGGHVIWKISMPLLGEWDLGVAAIPLTLFWFLGCMNAINLLDGMDGLAGGVSLIVCITMMLVGQLMGNFTGMLLMGCLGGGIFGFLIFNFHPARIFLGDSGSNVIGFLIAALAMMSSRKSETAVALIVPLLALGVPITDTALAILRRWSRRLPLSAPDRMHVHHRLLAMGLTQRRAVLVIYGICALLCAGAILSISTRRELLLTVFGAVGILAFVCVRILGGFRLGDLALRFTRDWQLHQACNEARIETERYAHFLPSVTAIEGLWRGCQPVLAKLGVGEARLVIDGPVGAGTKLVWRSDTCAPDPSEAAESWQVRLHITDGGLRIGHLTITGEVDSDHLFVPERVELIWRLRDLLAAQLPRLLNGASPADPRAPTPDP